MPFITLESRGSEIYYELHGDPSHKPVVLINGLIADHTGWGSMTEDLAKDHFVLVFDNRATGQTKDGGIAFNLETMADDAITLIDSLGLVKPVVVGHSMGGAISAILAKKYADKITKAVLCQSFIRFNEEAKAAFANTLKLHQVGASQAEIMDSIIPWVFSEGFVTPELLKIIHTSSNENPNAQTAKDYERQYLALVEFDASSWIHEIAIPVVVIGSKDDITATLKESEKLVDSIHGAKLEVLPGAHASAVEQPILFLKALRKHFCPTTCIEVSPS